MKPISFLLAATVLTLSAGCGTYPGAASAVFDGGSAVQVRSYQSRAFDTTDTDKTLRAVVTTLQDLGFMIDQADATLGTVTATKLSSHRVRATVSVRPHGTAQVLVRMNAQFSRIQLPDAARPLADPRAYQDFFTALAHTLFLTGHEVG